MMGTGAAFWMGPRRWRRSERLWQRVRGALQKLATWKATMSQKAEEGGQLIHVNRVVSPIAVIVSAVMVAGSVIGTVSWQYYSLRLDSMTQNAAQEKAIAELRNEFTRRIDDMQNKFLAVQSASVNSVMRLEWISWCERFEARNKDKGIDVPIPRE